MQRTKKDIHALIRKGETFHLECKKAQGGLPGSFWESYSAFCNTDGGVILLGVKEFEDKHFEAVGVNDAPKLVQDFTNTLNGSNKGFVYGDLNDKDAPAAKKQIVDELGYFISPSHLFRNIHKTAALDKDLNVTLEEVFEEAEGYNLSVSTYVEPKDTRVRVDIKKLNAQIAGIVQREEKLRKEVEQTIRKLGE